MVRRNRPPGTLPTGDRARSTTWLSACFAVAVIVLTGIAFAPILSQPFVFWDDQAVIVENVHIRKFNGENLRWMFSTFYMGPYHPLTWISFALDYQLWGLDGRGFHLTALLWHAAAAIALFLLSRRFFEIAQPGLITRPMLGRACAAFAALLFAVHPLRVESVAWATERKDVMSGCFAILAVLVYLRTHRPFGVSDPHAPAQWELRFEPAAGATPRQHETSRGHLGGIAAATLLFAASLLSKTIALGLPAVLSLLDFYPLRRLDGTTWWTRDSRHVWLEKLPFWLCSTAAAAAALWGQAQAGAMTEVGHLGTAQRAGVASYAVMFYCVKTMLPSRLSPHYEFPTDLAAWTPWLATSAIIAVAVTVALFRWRRAEPAPGVAWLSYLILLAPVSGVAQTGSQIAADRYTYIPCVAFAVLAGGVAARWGLSSADRSPRRSGIALCCGAAAILMLAGLTWRQCRIWRSDESLWRQALSVEPRSSMARSNLAIAAIRHGDWDRATGLLRDAVDLNPANAHALTNLGLVLQRRGESDAALRHLHAAWRLRSAADVSYNLALVYQQRHDWGEAARWYEQTLRIQPDYVKACNNLGICLKRSGRFNDAGVWYERAIRLDPEYADAHYNLAILRTEQGRFADARASLQAVLRLQPRHAAAAQRLAALGP